MKSLNHLTTALALALAGALVHPADAQTAPKKYVVVDLGSLDGSVGNTVAEGINNAGQVVGHTALGAYPAPSHAFRTGPNRAIQAADDLGTLGGASSFGYAINNAGQVVGDADTAQAGPFGSVVRRAFRADPGQAMVDLGTLAPAGGNNGFNNSGARAISDSGVVVGFATVPVNICLSASHAFRTAANAVINPATDDLGTLVPATASCTSARSSIAWGINGSGTAVGDSATTLLSGTPNHAFLDAGSGPMEDLGVLGAGLQSTARAINDRGETVGQSQVDGTLFSGMTRAFLKAGSNPLQDLGDLGGGTASAAAINTPLSGGDSQVVGNSYTGTALHGFVWTSTTGMVDLNSLIAAGSGWEVTFGRAINGLGQIVADALQGGVPYVYHAVRLDPSDVAVTVLIGELSDPALALAGGQVSSLTDKLQNAYASIQAGLNKQAINQLNAFVSSVQTYWKNGKISTQTATTLTNAANAIIAALQ